MTPTVYRVRELVVSYSPFRLSLPIPHTGRLVMPRDAAAVARTLLADAPVEKMIALHLSTKHHLIGVQVVSSGTLDTTIVHPRDVFQAALLSNAAGLMLAHNHPSGDFLPSSDDPAVCQRLRSAATVIGIDLLDFLIIGDSGYYSFHEAGL